MDDFLLILENNLSIFLGILQVKKSCKEGSVLAPCCGRRSLIGVSYWKRMPGCVNGERFRVYSINFTGEGFRIGCFLKTEVWL